MPLPQRISADPQKPDGKASAPRLDLTRLAALVAWIQESMTHISLADLSIVLSMARYTDLIDPDLESTLARIAKASAGSHKGGRAGIGDLILHIRQIEALLNSPDESANRHEDSMRRSA